jgi:hypothetical protein
MPFAKNYITGEWAFPPMALMADVPRKFKIVAKKKFARIDQIKSLL